MKRLKHLTMAALEYTKQDCLDAIVANVNNPKCAEYLATARACEDEIARRDRVARDRANWREYRVTRERYIQEWCIARGIA